MKHIRIEFGLREVSLAFEISFASFPGNGEVKTLKRNVNKSRNGIHKINLISKNLT